MGKLADILQGQHQKGLKVFAKGGAVKGEVVPKGTKNMTGDGMKSGGKTKKPKSK